MTDEGDTNLDQAEKLRNIIKKSQVTDSSGTNQEKKHARIFTVTSGKGGVGKSNTAINLAVQFRKLGKRVIILDADFGLANIEVMFGAIPKFSLADVVYKGMDITEVITNGPMDIGFISGGSGVVGMSNLSQEKINFLIANVTKLDDLADIIVIDTGAGISDRVIDFLIASEEILLVTTPEPTSITDSYSLLKALDRNSQFRRDEANLRVITNKVLSTDEGRQLYHKLYTVTSQYLNMPMSFLGVVPQDPALKNAVMQQSPVSLESPNARSTRAYKDIADTLLKIPHTDKIYKRGIGALIEQITSFA
ncbi:flagellar biosynthesis protein FlhG [Lachnospiraceae bacterium KH1T2]|nr:flagellar biosynthesis protein FlhG [Lachnospiraceae bacterium KH1T2]